MFNRIERDHGEHPRRRFSRRAGPLNRVDCYERGMLLKVVSELGLVRLGRVRRTENLTEIIVDPRPVAWLVKKVGEGYCGISDIASLFSRRLRFGVDRQRPYRSRRRVIKGLQGDSR